MHSEYHTVKVIPSEYAIFAQVKRATLIVQGNHDNMYINSIETCYITSGYIILPYGIYTNDIGGNPTKA